MIRQLFRLSKELADAVSNEEVNATWSALKEAGLARPPFAEFTVEFRLKDFAKLKNTYEEDVTPGDLDVMHYHFSTPDNGFSVDVTSDIVGPKKGQIVRNVQSFTIIEAMRDPVRFGPYLEAIEAHSGQMYMLLIVLLATKNVAKEVHHNPLARYGVGKQKALYTTTLRIGRITENADGSKAEPTGIGKRPHLRRGHIRKQHYGPRNSFIKTIFIEPVFVNADEEWIGERTAYNVSMSR